MISIKPKMCGTREAVSVKYRPVEGGKVKATLLTASGLRCEAHIVTCEATDKAVLEALGLEKAKGATAKAEESKVEDSKPAETPETANASEGGPAPEGATDPAEKAPKAPRTAKAPTEKKGKK